MSMPRVFSIAGLKSLFFFPSPFPTFSREIGEHFQPVRNFPPKHFSDLKLLIISAENT